MVLRTLGILLIASVSTASAQVTVTSVRVASDKARVMSRPSPKSEVVATPASGGALEALDKVGGWYWVLVERDSHGTQRAGWIRESDLEGFAKPETGEPANVEPAEPVVQEAPKAAQPKKVDDRRLKEAERRLEKARQELERLQPPAEPVPQN